MDADGKYQVCPNCDGEGFTSTLGAFTGADVAEWFGDDPEEREDFRAEYTRRGGVYDETCRCCKGQRVVTTERLHEWRDEQRLDAEQRAESYHGA